MIMKKDRSDDLITDIDANKKKLKMTVIKFVSTAVLLCVIIFVYTFSWFTMNKDDSVTGNDMKAKDIPYDIVCIESEKENAFQAIHDKIKTSGTVVWQMTDENNMENLGEDAAGIAPGSYGVVSFYVKPHNDSVNLDLTFDLVGYKRSSDDETDDTDNLTAIEGETLNGYLNSHIMLFLNRTEKTDSTGAVSYIYSEPILSGEDISKKVENKKFLKSDEDKIVNIYWVWPKTLSTLVDATSNEYVSTEPFCEGEDYNKICDNILKYPARYLYEYTQETDEDDNPIELDTKVIAGNYEKYGDLYDLADNQIGTNINYITLRMTTAESNAKAQGE